MKAFLGVTALNVACVSGAIAADMPAKVPMYTKAPMAAPAYSWTGFYVGVNAGYGWGNQAVNVSGDPNVIQPTFLTPAGISSVAGSPKGFIGGAQIGYNWQTGQMVYGLEADLDASHIASSQDIVFSTGGGTPRTVHGDQNLDWLGTFRARLGYTPIDRVLFYATGGLAVGHASESANFTTNAGCAIGNCEFGSAAKTMAGWTAGAGLEYALNRNWSVKGEYLYYRLGNIASTGLDTRFVPANALFGNVQISGSIVRIGLNYQFH